MRLFISIALYVLSIALALVGVAERTIWAPEQAKVLSYTVESPRPLLVIPNSVLKLHAGKPTVNVSGSQTVFVASGREADIEAWISGSSKTEVTFDTKAKKLISNSIDGVVPSINPAGSDLWRTERAAANSVSTKVDTTASGAILVASDGFKAAPGNLTITWNRNVDTTWSNVTLYLAAGVMLITLIYNFLVYRNIRNSRKPRRRLPKAPQGPRSRKPRRTSTIPKRGRRVAGRSLSIGIAGLAIAGLVTGCATGSSTVSKSSQTATKKVATTLPSALQLGQVRRIVSDVSRMAKAGDDTLNASALVTRFAGPAVEMRTSAYALIKKSKKAPLVDTITASPLTLSLPSATDSWPRTLMVVTGGIKGKLPVLLTLRQMSPRSQYQVWYYSTLLSGIKLPALPAIDVGSVMVAADSAYLQMLPTNIPTSYGSIIDTGSNSVDFGKYQLEGDTFYSQIAKIQTDQLASIKNAKLQYQHVLADNDPVGLSTADGGAIVAVYMKDVTTIRPTKANSGITVNALEQVALGSQGSLKGVVSTYGDMLVFYIPSVGQTSKIRLLGWQAGLIKVKSL